VASLTPAGLSLVSTNNRYLLDVLERSRSPLEMGPHDTNIVKLTSRILTHNHYLQQLLDDTVSMRFLDRYLQSLDNLHMHFLQSDLQEFEKYRTTLDDLTYKDGALEPAFEIYTRFMDRLE